MEVVISDLKIYYLGYPPSAVYYWEVGTSRGPEGLDLNFLNLGVKFLYDEGLLKAFQSALSCLRTGNNRTEVSLGKRLDLIS